MLPRPWRSRRAWCQVLRGGPGANGPGAHVLKGPGPAAKYLAPSMLGRPWSREHRYRSHIPMFSEDPGTLLENMGIGHIYPCSLYDPGTLCPIPRKFRFAQNIYTQRSKFVSAATPTFSREKNDGTSPHVLYTPVRGDRQNGEGGTTWMGKVIP